MAQRISLHAWAKHCQLISSNFNQLAASELIFCCSKQIFSVDGPHVSALSGSELLLAVGIDAESHCYFVRFANGIQKRWRIIAGPSRTSLVTVFLVPMSSLCPNIGVTVWKLFCLSVFYTPYLYCCRHSWENLRRHFEQRMQIPSKKRFNALVPVRSLAVFKRACVPWNLSFLVSFWCLALKGFDTFSSAMFLFR